MYLRYGIPYRLQRSLKTAVRAVKVTTTVFWDIGRVVLDNTTLGDATVMLLPYQDVTT